MSLFSRKQPTIKGGLQIVERKDGDYGIRQRGLSYDFLNVASMEQAEEAKQELNRLINWGIDEDVYLMIMTKENGFYESLYPALDRILKKYQLQRTDAVSTNYLLKNGNEVSGYLVTEGLSVHQHENGQWVIYHLASQYKLSYFDEKEHAINCAKQMAPLVYWEQENVLDLFLQAPDFCAYLADVKVAVLNGKPIPTIPQGVLYKTEFFRMNLENADFPRYAKAIDKLSSMVGMKSIKEDVMNMVYDIAGQVKMRKEDDEERHNLHMVFSGPAGTGKTEMARIMSDIFGSLGYLKKGHLKEVTREDLVGQHLGETEKFTKDAIEDAMGGTLFIDEAYNLAGDKHDLGHLAITALIKEMEDRRGEFAVILAGYEADMKNLMNMNEGFQSRIKKTLSFYDYTPEQVLEIVFRMFAKKEYILSDEVRKEVEKAVKAKAKNGAIEGNARTGRNIYEEICRQARIRVAKNNVPEAFLYVVEVEDVKRATGSWNSESEREELETIKKEAQQKLDSLIGLTDLKDECQRILNTILVDKMRYEHGLTSEKTRMHMMFYGPPGTGKTTVARIMGEFLKGAGVLSNGHFKEVSRSELVAGYVGQTALKVKEAVNKAMGGILFIDEAYALANGDKFGKEALDELIKEMENNADNLVVIMAGYRKDMDKLFALNEGLRSRVPYHFDFPHYAPDELYDMAELTMEKTYGLLMDDGAKVCLRNLIEEEAKKTGGYIEGDGRWVRNLMESIKINQANRLVVEMVDTHDPNMLMLLQQVKEEDVRID